MTTVETDHDAGPTAEVILQRVEELGPRIDDAADQVNELRRMPDDLTEDLRRAGVFRMGFPLSWGGPEMRLEDQVRVIELLAMRDASVAWNVMILADSGFWAGFLPDDVAHEIYPSMDLGTAGAFNPPGRAERVDGGYRVTGRWPFGSGLASADLVQCGCHVHDDGGSVLEHDGSKQLWIAYVPKGEVTVHDNWFTTGLHGSGSSDYSVEDVFVPETHMIRYVFEGDATLPPLSRYTDIMMVNQWGVPLGIAARVLQELRATATTRTTRTGAMRDEYRVQVGLAEAQGRLEAARAYVYETATQLSDALWAGRMLTDNERARMLSTSVTGGHLARRALELAIEVVGAGSVFASSPYDRALRDMLTATNHVIFQRKFLQGAGQLMLGVPAESVYG
jgi:alkylation response protein AidB-like acyl-CoA dehydrogenase